MNQSEPDYGDADVLKDLQDAVAGLPEPDRLRVETAAKVLRRFVAEQGPWGEMALGLVGAEVAAGVGR